MRRRTLLALAGALAAAPASAFADERRESLGEAFPLLSGYLSVHPSSRSLFYPAYRATRHGRLAPQTRARVEGGPSGGFPIEIDHLGFVTRLPTLADFHGGAYVVFEGEAFRFQLEARATEAPSSRADPALLAHALSQLNASLGSIAGHFAFLIPRLTAAFFPDARAGRATFADGRTQTLPVFHAPIDGPTPYFQPAHMEGANAILLDQRPTRITLGIPR